MFNYLPDTTSVFLSHGSDVEVNPLLEYVPPLILFDRQTLNFEALEINNSKSDSVLITNSSLTSQRLILTLPDPVGYVIDNFIRLIHPDSSRLLNITFTPSEVHDYSENLLINSEAGEDTILLRGIGLNYQLEPKKYKSPGIDSMLITAFLPTTSLRVFGLIQTIDSTLIDSIELFNEGDSIYSNSWHVAAGIETDYYVDLALYSANSGEIEFHGLNRRFFTSIGPIELESFSFVIGDSIFSPGETLLLRPSIINSGLHATAFDITAELATGDSCIADIFNRTNTLSEIAVGDTLEISGLIVVTINENCAVDTDIPLNISFLSNGVPLWENEFIMHISPVAVEDELKSLPNEYFLSQNYPNPFNPVTTLSYSLPVSGEVRLIVYNLGGEEVIRLVDDFQQAGEYNSVWNASNVSSGIYFYRLQAGKFTETKKMVLLK